MSAASILADVRLNEPRFLELLDKLIGESEFLQNSPPQGLIPKEDLAIKHVLDILTPLSTEKGGPLVIERVTFVEGRGNLIIKYPGTGDSCCSFVGSHMDVVPADKANWERDPFHLHQEGDKLYGRGTTDCLGHVAMLTDLLATFATTRYYAIPCCLVGASFIVCLCLYKCIGLLGQRLSKNRNHIV